MKEFIDTRYPLNFPFGYLQLFAGEDGGEGGTGGEGGSGGKGGEGGEPGKGDKTFTQAEIDAILQKRLSRAEKDAVTALAKELGFESVEAMKASLKKPGDDGKGGKSKKEDQDDKPVDVEKLVEEKLKAEREKSYQRLLTAEVKVVANELGFADWEDSYKLADLSKCKENDKGEIEGVKEALEELAKKKPHLLKVKKGTGAFGADIVSNGGSGGDKKARLERMKELAQGKAATVPANDPWRKQQ